MNYNEFEKDLKYSLIASEDKMFDDLYTRIWGSWLKNIEKVEDIERQMLGIDKILTFYGGKQVMVDEKKRRKNYDDILIEIWSNKEKKTKGWVFKSHTDYVVYGIMPIGKAYLIPSLLLKAWVRSEWDNLNSYQWVYSQNPTYVTASIVVTPSKLFEGLNKVATQQLYDNQ